MHQKIHAMTHKKACGSFWGNIFAKSKMRCKPQVAAQANRISYGIGNIDINPPVKQQVNPIMDYCCGNSHDAKTDKLTKTLVTKDTPQLIPHSNCPNLYKQYQNQHENKFSSQCFANHWGLKPTPTPLTTFVVHNTDVVSRHTH